MQVVVVGTGRWGQIHCEKVQSSTWATLAGVVDSNPVNAQRAAEVFEVPVFSSIAECREADFIIIATPWRAVAGLVDQACSLGRSFLAEKPVSVSSDAISRLQHLARQSNVVDCVGYQMRFHPGLEDFDVSDTLHVVREERTFDSLWDMICDCGVHDIDLAIRLAGAVSRLTEFKAEGTRLDVRAMTVRGIHVHWQWRVGTQVTRLLESGSHVIDLTQASEDLLSNQWDAVQSRFADRPSAVAGLRDAYSVARVLDALRSRAQIA